MAQRKTVAVDDALRASLAASWRAWHARLRDFQERLGSGPPQPWFLDRAGALDRREPVEAAGWELPRELLPAGSANTRFVIESDGSLRVVEKRPTREDT